MGLTSPGTLSLLILLVFGCMAATVRAWPRAAGPGPRAAGARALMLAGCQLSVLLTLVAALNAHYLF